MNKETRFGYYKCTFGVDAWSFKTFSNPNKNPFVTDGPAGVRKRTMTGHTLIGSGLMSASAIAASFKRDVAYKNAAIAASDCLSRGNDILLAPGVNIKRNVLCGRNFEYYSEDPFLSGVLAANYINGLQDNGVGACIKHYCCNGKEFARKVNSSELSLRALNEIYLMPFRYAFMYSSPVSLMTSYNKVNGEYVTESEYLLKNKLKGEMNYKGLIISDWGSVVNKAKTIKAGLHIQMPCENHDLELLDEEFNKGVFSEEDLIRNDLEATEAIKKINLTSNIDHIHNFDDAHEKLIELGKYGQVLIKNDDNYLPFKQENKILVVGYLAKFAKNVGEGSGFVNSYKKEQIIDVLENRNVNFIYLQGYNEDGTVDINEKILNEYKNKGFNKVLVVLGQYALDESEEYERTIFGLHQEQIKAVEIIKKVYKDFASVIITGSVIGIENLYKDSKSILVSYLSGEGQSTGIIDVLWGNYNPSGRLPETWIGDLSQNSLYESIINKDIYYTYYDEDIFVGYRYYIDHREGFILPFGFGLSYGEVRYDDFEVKLADDVIKCAIKVSNNNTFSITAVPQIYVSKSQSNIYRSKIELKGFDSILLKAHESKEIVIDIPIKSLCVYEDYSDSMKVENGYYQISLGINAFELLFTKEIYVPGEELIESKSPKALARKVINPDFNYETPFYVLLKMSDEPLKEFFSKIEDVNYDDIYEFMTRNISNLGLPIIELVRNYKITYKQLNDLINFYNSLPHEFIRDISNF